MAQLPDVGAPRYNPRSNRPVASSRAGEITGNAMADAGQAIVRIGEERQAREDYFATAKAKSQMLAAQLEFERSTAEDRDFETLPKRYQEHMKKVRDTVGKTIRTNPERARFDLEMDDFMVNSTARVADRADRIRVDTGRADLASMEDQMRTSALEAGDEATRSTIIQTMNEALSGAVASGYITAQERVARQRQWVQSYALGRMDVMEPTERIAALEKPEGTAAQYLDADVRVKLLRDARAEVATNQIEARQAMNDRLRDIGAAAQAGLPIDDVPSEAELKGLYGDHEGAQRYAAARTAQKLSRTVAAMHSLPTDELIAQVGAAAPKQVEGAADQAQIQGFLVERTAAILRERDKDPAGYLVQYSPAVREEWAAMSADPEASPEGYLRALRAERERLGLPGTDVVPAEYAATVADTVNSATAENLATTFDTLAQQWGAAWPQLYGQIAKDVPSTALVIGAGIPRAAATALAATATLKEGELRAMLPPSTTWNDVQTEVNEAFGDFVASMPAEAARTTLAVKDAAVRLATHYMSSGSGLGDAVAKAHRDLVDSQYSLIEMNGATIRVPAGLDADQVEDVASKRLGTFGADPAELQRAIVVPPGTALAAEEYQSRYRDYVRDNGYWLTNPSSTGIRLYVDGGPVAGPVEMTWDELMAPGRAAAEAAQQRRQRPATMDPAELKLRQ